MARATTVTKLPIDSWAAIMGIHPMHFAGLYSDTYMPDTTCGMTWMQYSWMNADRISREEIAQAIKDAEDDIEALLGYHLLPDWIVKERLPITRPAVRETFNMSGRNVRGQRISVQTNRGHILSGGVRTKTGIETVAVVRSDTDGDGYAETVTATVSTSVEDADEIKVYHLGFSGADDYEIRPIEVSIDTDADVATITFKSWQLIKPDLQENIKGVALDAEDATNYDTQIDVYRVYNDPSTQVQFLWENDLVYNTGCGSCTACTLGTQYGCFHNRDARLGIIVPAPATWSASDQAFSVQNFSTCRGPDQVRLWYYSGYRDMRLSRPKSEMAKEWQYAVAYLAAARLQKPSCGCDNVTTFIEHWQEMREFSSQATGTYFQTPSQLTNPLGSTNGAKYAYEKICKPGRRLGTNR